MRSFVFACGELLESHRGSTIGTAALGSTLIALATNFFWPLLEEVRPKLGKYEPLVGTAQDIAETIFQECGGKNSGRRTALVHRDITSRLSKPFEILEYAGFLSRREASRAMKSGGRGSTYALNLCNLLERVPQARLTIELFERWTTEREEPVEFHTRGTHLFDIESPPLDEDADLSILAQPVESLQKSRAYPYGLTDQKIKVLQEAGIITVGDLAKASDQELLALRYVGEATIRRFRNVVGQAVWM